MDGKHFKRFIARTRVTDRRRRVSRLAIGLAMASLVPGTAAFAVSDDLAVAAPGFNADVTGPEQALPELPGMGKDEAGFAATDAVQAEISDIAEELGIGMASWYGPKFAGKPTASGERFDPSGLTAAHRTLPFGSLVRVTSQSTGKAVIVRINDRGPFHGNRVIDLSEAAADAIGIKSRGRGRVSLALLEG